MLNQVQGDEVDNFQFTWPKRSCERKQRFLELYRELYIQILHGCGSSDCTNSVCATFRKRHSKCRFRPYTAPTARSIALHLASKDQASSRLCSRRRSGGVAGSSLSFGNTATEDNGPWLDHGSNDAQSKRDATASSSSKEREPVEQDERTTLQTVDNKTIMQDKATSEQRISSRKDPHSLVQWMFDSVAINDASQPSVPVAPQYTEQHSKQDGCNAFTRLAEDRKQKVAQPDDSASLTLENGQQTQRQRYASKLTISKMAQSFEVDGDVDRVPTEAVVQQHPHLGYRNLLHRMPQSGRPLQWSLAPPVATESSGLSSVTEDVMLQSLGVRRLGRTPSPQLLSHLTESSQQKRLKNVPERIADFLDLMSSSQDLLMSFSTQITDLPGFDRVFSMSFAHMSTSLNIPPEHGYLASEIFSGLWQNCQRILPAQPTGIASAADLHKYHQSVLCSDPGEDSDQMVHEIAHFSKICMAVLTAHLEEFEWRSLGRGFFTSRNLQKLGCRSSIEVNFWTDPADVIAAADIFLIKFEDEVCQSIVDRICMTLACQKYIDEDSSGSAGQVARIPTALELFVQGLTDDLAIYFEPSLSGFQNEPVWLGADLDDRDNAKYRLDNCSHWATDQMIEWFRNVIVRHWDGRTEIVRCSPLGGALDILGGIYTRYEDWYRADDALEMPYIYTQFDVVDGPAEWVNKSRSQDTRHLLDYPFLFPDDLKVSYFRAINHATMKQAHKKALAVQTLANRLTYGRGPSQPGQLRSEERLSIETDNYLVLEIRRAHVLKDAFDQLWRRRKQDLLRPLRVLLGYDEGEEGSDHGGVQLEFFRIAFAEALDPIYGVFTTHPVTHMAWLQPGSFEPLYKFELLGLLVSLAIYNGLTLPLTLPLAFYMKLLGREPEDLDDIEDGWPELAKGLRELLEWEDDDVEDVFCREYTFSVEKFGTVQHTDMTILYVRGIPIHTSSSTDTPMVTNVNRDQYVRDYIRHLTTVSIAPQFEAFAKGFKTVIEPKSLTLFTPTTLQSLIEGDPVIDTRRLHAAARYEDGYTVAHPVIQNFWSVVHGWASSQANDPSSADEPSTPPPQAAASNEAGQKKVRQLLEFVTASDRLPVGGESRLLFTIQMVAGDDDQLPRSMTCFGRLLLPAYSNKEVLKERLEKAMEYAKGFGTS